MAGSFWELPWSLERGTRDSSGCAKSVLLLLDMTCISAAVVISSVSAPSCSLARVTASLTTSSVKRSQEGNELLQAGVRVLHAILGCT